jgi:hypothetical protein
MPKFDAVIEAVRYKGGKIDLVRVYERRWPTFSDRVLLDRKTLLQRMREGRRFVTGQRQEFMASTFDVDKIVRTLGTDERQIVTTLAESEHDQLEGVPAF